ncbi:MAG TPA: class I SAM-dependent rRNA methyltransferase [Desulfomonilia bacterium]|nr:class I SAM-dependent rRNA methyltransferase [Desulfomonilia bacterium]
MLIVHLKAKKEVPVINGHPWIYSGAVEKVQGEPGKEHLCRVLNARGQFVCQGMYNPISQLAVRVLTLGKDPIDKTFFETRIKNALALRERIIPQDTSCYRIINGEGDLLPGLVVDRYNDVLVMQIITPFMEEIKPDIVEILKSALSTCSIFERSDSRTRSNEGFRPFIGPLSGDIESRDLVVHERGISYAVDIFTGDRTGFYLEHRETRQKIMNYAHNRDVLDLFSYTGSFSLCALKAGARSVISVDSSAPAQVQLKKNMEMHGIKPFVWRHIRDDVARFLSDEQGSFDLVLCDAPAFGNEYEEHSRTVTNAMARLRPGGVLFYLAPVTSQFSPVDLLKAISRSAQSLSRTAKVLEPLSQSADFPSLPSHPQGMHQTGFVAYIE